MLNFLLVFCTSLKPVLLIPGHGGSSAWATITKPQIYEGICPPLNNFQFWPMNETFSKQYPDCMGYLIRASYNMGTNTITHPEGIQFRVEERGKLDSLYNYVELVKYMENKGYQQGANLFGYPYDWVLYYPGLPTFFDDLQSYIEDIKNQTNQKVVVMGHSMGTHVVRMLISSHASNEWVKEHIDSVEFLAPAFYGCFVSFNNVVQGKFGALPPSNVTAQSAQQMPSLHLLWDNYKIFEDHSVFQNVPDRPNGVKPSEVEDYLISIGRFDREARAIFRFVEKSLKDEPVEPIVPSYILYNSGISTPIALDASKQFSFINKSGDAVCHSGGPEYACGHWTSALCFDWKKNDWLYSHSQMMYRKDTLDKIYRFIGNNENNEAENGNWLITGIAGAAISLVFMIVIIVLLIMKRSQHNDYNYQY